MENLYLKISNRLAENFNRIRTMDFYDSNCVNKKVSNKIFNNTTEFINLELNPIHNFSNLLYWIYENEKYPEIKENVRKNILKYLVD